jgi:hypothetical protein
MSHRAGADFAKTPPTKEERQEAGRKFREDKRRNRDLKQTVSDATTTKEYWVIMEQDDEFGQKRYTVRGDFGEFNPDGEPMTTGFETKEEAEEMVSKLQGKYTRGFRRFYVEESTVGRTYKGFPVYYPGRQWLEN